MNRRVSVWKYVRIGKKWRYCKPARPVQLKPDQQTISGYFNIDSGSGKILGVYLEEDTAVAPIFAQWIECYD